MAYNNYPMGGYSPQFYYPQMPAQQPQAQNGVIWVQGETGAKSYLVAPGNTVHLWDTESQTIYIKSADASGIPSMKVLDYTVRNTNQPAAPVLNAQESKTYVTREELKEFEERFERRLNELTGGAKHESAV